MSENSTPIDSILNKESNDTNTPIESFINHKADTGMQCGNYSIDIPELKEVNNIDFILI